MTTPHRPHPEPEPVRPPDLVRWGSVVAGAVIGLAVFALLNALWLAVAAGVGGGWVAGHLAWFLGASAMGSLLLAGIVAGGLSGVRGAAAGMANGVTAWGLLFVLSLTAFIPGTVDLTSRIGSGVADRPVGSGFETAGGAFTIESALWTTFWSLLAGLVLAAIGGLLGSRLRRPGSPSEEQAWSEPDSDAVEVPTQQGRSSDDGVGAVAGRP